MNKLTLVAGILAVAWMDGAIAAKAAETVRLSAGPFLVLHSCNVTNHTEQTMDVQFLQCSGIDDNTSPDICDDRTSNGVGTIAPGNYAPTIPPKGAPGDIQTCKLRYTGKPGDITGLACGTIFCGSDGTTTCYTTACAPLQ